MSNRQVEVVRGAIGFNEDFGLGAVRCAVIEIGYFWLCMAILKEGQDCHRVNSPGYRHKSMAWKSVGEFEGHGGILLKRRCK